MKDINKWEKPNLQTIKNDEYKSTILAAACSFFTLCTRIFLLK